MAIKKKSVKDVYSQKAYLNNTMTAANTVHFEQFTTSYNIDDKIAWLINRIEYFPNYSNCIEQMTATEDFIYLAICGSDQLTDLGLNRSLVYDAIRIVRNQAGLAANDTTLLFYPITKDFGNLPGGGLLVSPISLYTGIQTAGLAAVASFEVILHFQTIELDADAAFQLTQALRILR